MSTFTRWWVAGFLLWSLGKQGWAVPVTLSGAPSLIQIGVEVVEVNEQKTQALGVEWINQLRLQEISMPSVLKIGTIARDKVFADLQALMEHGAADLLANPKLVTRDSSTATFHAG